MVTWFAPRHENPSLRATCIALNLSPALTSIPRLDGQTRPDGGGRRAGVEPPSGPAAAPSSAPGALFGPESPLFVPGGVGLVRTPSRPHTTPRLLSPLSQPGPARPRFGPPAHPRLGHLAAPRSCRGGLVPHAQRQPHSRPAIPLRPRPPPRRPRPHQQSAQPRLSPSSRRRTTPRHAAPPTCPGQSISPLIKRRGQAGRQARLSG